MLFNAKFAPFILLSLSAHAGYTKNCIDRLSHDFPREHAFQFVRNEWEPVITALMNGVRPLTNTEFEAFKDIFHGLPLTATFRDERTVDFYPNDESIQKLRRLLFETQIVQIQHLPQARAAMRYILKSSCVVLGRAGCDLYDHYAGMTSPEDRPFSSREEQAIKWATIHMVPPQQVFKMYQKPLSEARSLVDRAHQHHQLLSAYLLVRAFGEDDGEKLYDKFARGFIDAGYESVLRLAQGELPN